MLPQLQAWMYGQVTFAGVECLQKGEGLCYRVCWLKKEKNSAKILRQVDQIEGIEALKAALEPGMPVVLGLNVKGALHRLLERPPESDEAALAAVFPSAQPADFQVQQVPTATKTLVSVMRKDRMNALVEPLLAAELWVVQVWLGPFIVQDILPILPHWTATLQVGEHRLEVEQQQIVGFSKAMPQDPQAFNIGGETVAEPLVYALSLALGALTQPNQPGLPLETVAQRRVDFYYKTLFRYTAMGLLGFFFVALLANYLLFEHYQQQQQEWSIEVAQQRSLLEQRDALIQQYNDKTALFGDQLHLGQSKASYYADRLAATLPSTLQLTQLVLFPVIQEEGYNREETLPRYEQHTILVEGTCQASVFYNNWKRALEELDWVAAIHNLSYQNDPSGRGIFKLKITLAHE